MNPLLKHNKAPNETDKKGAALCKQEAWKENHPSPNKSSPFILSGIFDRGKYTGNTVFKTVKLKPFIIYSVIHMF